MTAKQKQHLLAFLGYYTGTVDGIWGKQSQDATARFQKDFGLTADGAFGDATDERIRKAIGSYDDLILDVPANRTAPEESGAVAETVTGDFWDEIEFFKREEFRCQCGGKYCNGFPAEPQEKLIRVADKIRKALGAAATVSSGVRCQTHNANVGGVSNSRHLTGKAMDFCVAGKSASQLLAEVNKHPEIRYAYDIDGTFVHMDIE